MNQDYDIILTQLNNNIQKLILMYNEEVDINLVLSKEVEKISNELNIQKERYQEIEKKYDNLKLAKVLNNENDGDKEAKLKLNKIIREIDNCIALLNK